MNGWRAFAFGVQRMAKEKMVDKDAFDAVLKRLIDSPPMPLKQIVGKGKRPESGQPKQPKTRRK